MIRLRSMLFIVGLILIVLLLIACGATEAPAVSTAAPPSPPAPSTSEGPTTASEVPRLSVEDLKQKLDDGEAIVVIDTRGKSSYDTRHISGAIVEPESYDELPLDKEIVFYCT